MTGKMVIRAAASRGPVNSVPAFGSTGSLMRTNTTYHPLRDLREASPTERKEQVKSSRFLRARLGLVRALFENSSRYAIGSGGLSPSAESTDREWSKLADDWFEDIVTRPAFDVREEHDFYSMQTVICPDMMCDGDLGAAKIRSEDDGEAALQLFPTEAIGDGLLFGGLRSGMEGWNDGILRDARGKKLRYRILKSQLVPRGKTMPGASTAYFEYPSQQFLHIGRFDRINLNRPMPWLHHGDGSCTDVMDLTALEKVAAKINSYFAAVIQTKTGEVPLGFEAIMVREPSTIATVDSAGAATTKSTNRNYVQLEGGAAIPVLAEGESFNAFNTSRPSTTFAGFIDWLVNDIAWGFGVPPQFVWTLGGMTGPNARLVLQQADWFFRHIAEVMVQRFCQPVWDGVIGDAIERGKLPLPADGKWRAVAWQGPGAMTIDKGRDGKLYQALVQNGMLSRSAWHEMAGKHGLRERRRIIEERAEDIAYCEEHAVPLELYFGQGFGQQVAEAAGADPEETAAALVNALEGEGRGLRAV
jgi:capsid protein